jgi:hypothetical protein
MKLSDCKFRLVKAIVGFCQSEEDICAVIKVLDSVKSRSEVLGTLKRMLNDRTAHSTGKKPGVTSFKKLVIDDAKKLRLLRLIDQLKSWGITSAHVHQLVRQKYGKDIPIHKEGLDRYLKRVSRQPFFEMLISDLLIKKLPISTSRSGDRKTDSKTDTDPWLEKMLAERKPKGNEKKN